MLLWLRCTPHGEARVIAGHQNPAELREFTRKQRVQAGRALMAGRKAYHAGLDGVADNPHTGWQKLPEAQHSFQCLLWCRWLLGWLREYFRERASHQL